MVTRILLTLLLCGLSSMYGAAQTAQEAFMSMPAALCPYLTPTNKADLPDFLAAGMKARVKNRFDEWTEMAYLTPDSLELRIGESAAIQLALVPSPQADGKMIRLAHTVFLPNPVRQIRYFTPLWKPQLPAF